MKKLLTVLGGATVLVLGLAGPASAHVEPTIEEAPAGGYDHVRPGHPPWFHGPMDDVYRRIQSNRRVEIRFVAEQERGIAVLRRQPGFVDLQIDGPKVTVEIAADEAALAAVVEEFAREGVRFHSFADLDPTLEDVFMLVTKGAVN